MAILIIAIFVPLDFLFRFILPADQILLCLLGNIAAAKLIGADPGNGGIPVGKGLLFYSIRDLQFITNLVTIVTINDGIVPNNDVFTTAFPSPD